jgi:hypothetical protein
LSAFAAARIAAGYFTATVGFSTNVTSDTYLRKGVFACYRPLPPDAPMPASKEN